MKRQFALGFLIALSLCALPWLLKAIGWDVLKLQLFVLFPGIPLAFVFGVAAFQDPRWWGDSPFAVWVFSFIFYGLAMTTAIRFRRSYLDRKRDTNTE